MFAQEIGCEWAFLRSFEPHLGIGAGDVAFGVTGDNGERLAERAVDFEIDGALETGLVAGVGLADAAVEFRIARFPNAITAMNAREVEIATTEAKNTSFPASRKSRASPANV